MTQVKKDIQMVNGAALATIELALNLEDFDRVKRSGPLSVNFGGDFASTGHPQGTQPLKANNQTITTVTFKVGEKFTAGANPADNEQIATDWLADIESKISTAIGAVRTNDAAIVDAFPTYANI